MQIVIVINYKLYKRKSQKNHSLRDPFSKAPPLKFKMTQEGGGAKR